YWEPEYLRLPALGWRVAPHTVQSDVIGEFPANARLKLVIAASGIKAEDARLIIRVSSDELPEPLELSEYTIIKAKDE
ncbi:MAG: hypothetical protein ACKVT0_18520, partial [Planctomycetaceae bacterium]